MAGGVVKPPNRSWITLIGFFAVVTLASSLVFAAVFAGVTVAIGDESAQVADEPQVGPIVPAHTFSGIITDARCGPRHTNGQKSASESARICVDNGSRYTIVDGNKKYELSGKLRRIGQYAGQRVTLTGNLDGQTIEVSSISPLAEGGRAH
jgi:hypothetical protein